MSLQGEDTQSVHSRICNVFLSYLLQHLYTSCCSIECFGDAERLWYTFTVPFLSWSRKRQTAPRIRFASSFTPQELEVFESLEKQSK